MIHIRPGDANSKVVKGYLADLEDIPLSLARKIKALGIQIYLGNVSICKLGPAPPPCNETPPGWPSGTTYANVPGCGGLKEVDAGRGNSDAWSVVLHEFGHALGSDPRLGSGETPPAYDPGFLALHRRYYEELDPYSQGSGPGSPDGAEETFAEAFDGIVCHAPDLREYYPRPITDWIKHRLGLR